jgi:hypothetical protein
LKADHRFPQYKNPSTGVRAAGHSIRAAGLPYRP